MAHILVVDDNPSNRENIREILLEDDHEIEEAGDGQEALAKALASPPDLLLLDCLMPTMGGIETMKRLRRDARTAGVPIIVVTAIGRDLQMSACLAEGAVEYLMRPFANDDLRGAVSRVLQQHCIPGSTSNIVCVVGVRNGVGATYVATMLAALTAHRRRADVNLLELSRAPGGLAKYLGIESQRPVTDPLAIVGTSDAVPKDVSEYLIRHPAGLNVALVTADATLSPRAARTLISSIGGAGRCTYVDLPSADQEVARAVIEMAHQTILVTESDANCVAAAKEWLDRLEDWHVDRKGISLVVVCKEDGCAEAADTRVRASLDAVVVGVVGPDPDCHLLSACLREDSSPSDSFS